MTPGLKRRIRRVNHEIRMGDLMMKLGYRVRDTSQEQQFACDLHGPDRKPSARLYPATNSTYCWVCHKARRPIHLMMERENVGLEQAVNLLEDMYLLPFLPPETAESEVDFQEPDLENLEAEMEMNRLFRFLQNTTREQSSPMELVLWAWEKYDLVVHLHNKGKLDNPSTLAALHGIMDRMLSHDGRSATSGAA